MRGALYCGLVAMLLGCAATPPPKPTPAPSAEEQHQACAARMYAARTRGAVHWHIYENCLNEKQ